MRLRARVCLILALGALAAPASAQTDQSQDSPNPTLPNPPPLAEPAPVSVIFGPGVVIGSPDSVIVEGQVTNTPPTQSSVPVAVPPVATPPSAAAPDAPSQDAGAAAPIPTDSTERAEETPE